jgi:hypothetical protein
MIISPKYKFVFIANPKSGSATIHYTLLDCIKDKELINESRHRLGDKHLSCSALIEQRPQYKNYFKFAFVRNPWHRVVSWYFFEKKCKNSRRNTSNISFKDYINDSKCKNGIWANIQQYQYEFTKNCDFIGRTENLKEDFNIVCDKIQIPTMMKKHEKLLRKSLQRTLNILDINLEIMSNERLYRKFSQVPNGEMV